MSLDAEETELLLAIGETVTRIDTHLDRIHKEIITMAETQAAFDGDLTNLANSINQLIAAYQAASAKASAAGVDLSAEDAQVQQLSASITSALTSASPAPAAPVVPAAGAAGAPDTSGAVTDNANPVPPAI
jgi:chromosome segregation ATPase